MFSKTFVALAITALAIAWPSRTIGKRQASCSFPEPPSTSSLSAPRAIAAGKSFDGGNVRFDHGARSCMEQHEGGDSDAVFLVEEGGSISNVIIGADQAGGIHCLGSCTLTNVWYEDVCGDAITIKQTGGTSTITRGGAMHAEDKVVQHNGAGTVIIKDYCVEDFGKLYRSCGKCDEMFERIRVFPIP